MTNGPSLFLMDLQFKTPLSFKHPLEENIVFSHIALTQQIQFTWNMSLSCLQQWTMEEKL
jgi:hypothetical protein